jgi:hypothetical protein
MNLLKKHLGILWQREPLKKIRRVLDLGEFLDGNREETAVYSLWFFAYSLGSHLHYPLQTLYSF